MLEQIFNQSSDSLNVAVIGASGGIGSALVRQLIAGNNCENIYGLSRSPISEEHRSLTYIPINVVDEMSVQRAAETINSPLDLVIVAVGILHNDSDLKPEKSLQQFTAKAFIDNTMINSIAPVLVAKYFLPLMKKQTPAVFAALSARVGSISDNRLGGWHSYRASKAALNMLIKNIAIEYQRKLPKSIIVGLHPGTVDTGLSKPFQGNVPEGKLFSPDQSANYLLSVVDQLDSESSGRCFAWDGKEIPA